MPQPHPGRTTGTSGERSSTVLPAARTAASSTLLPITLRRRPAPRAAASSTTLPAARYRRPAPRAAVSSTLLPADLGRSAAAPTWGDARRGPRAPRHAAAPGPRVR
ncbi:UNVERIFIED_CONTAM: hypothetical protein RF648_07595 [Kocuria sp. CPCC 205274]